MPPSHPRFGLFGGVLPVLLTRHFRALRPFLPFLAFGGDYVSLRTPLFQFCPFPHIYLFLFFVLYFPSPFARGLSFTFASLRAAPSVFVFAVTLFPRVPTKLIVSPLSGNLYVNRLESVESHAYV